MIGHGQLMVRTGTNSTKDAQAPDGSLGSLGGILGDEDRAARISADNKKLLAFGGRALGLAGLAAFLAGVQQAQLRKSYEAELERRSFGNLDPDLHPSGKRISDLQ